MKSIKIRLVNLGSVYRRTVSALKTRCTLLNHGFLSLIRSVSTGPGRNIRAPFATNALDMISSLENNVTARQQGIPTSSDRTNLQTQYCRLEPIPQGKMLIRQYKCAQLGAG